MKNRRFVILYPFSLLYGLITRIRNFLYDSGILSSVKFNIPVICVGNITVGGTGKTPHIEYLISLLTSEFNLAVLSRGYKRKSKGFITAGINSSVRETGDEPLQIFMKFPDTVVAVDRNRRNGITRIMKEYPETDLIILDDGFQHRKVKPGFSLVLTDIGRLITRDHLLPYGRLRESSKNRERADIIIVTKTGSGVTDDEFNIIERELQTFPGQKVFFTGIIHQDPVPVFEQCKPWSGSFPVEDPSGKGVVLVTGIAETRIIKRFIASNFSEIIHLDFPDHHYFNQKDLERISMAWQSLFSPRKFIITTEKDAVRLKEFTNIAREIKDVLYYLPIEVNFLRGNKSEFDSLILEYVRKNRRNSRVSKIQRN